MIGNDGISDIAGAKSVGLDTFYIHSNISPKLPEETVILPDGTEKKRKVMPDADFVLDGTSSVSYEISFAVVFLYYEYVISRVVSTVKR